MVCEAREAARPPELDAGILLPFKRHQNGLIFGELGRGSHPGLIEEAPEQPVQVLADRTEQFPEK
jgi:hypothetical protein